MPLISVLTINQFLSINCSLLVFMSEDNWILLEYEGGETFRTHCTNEGKRTIVMITCKAGETEVFSPPICMTVYRRLPLFWEWEASRIFCCLYPTCDISHKLCRKLNFYWNAWTQSTALYPSTLQAAKWGHSTLHSAWLLCPWLYIWKTEWDCGTILTSDTWCIRD